MRSERTPCSLLCRYARGAGFIVTIAASGTGCGSNPAITADTANARVLALMECVECNRGERAAVLALGQSARPALQQALSGPDPHRLAVVDSSLRYHLVPAPSPDVIRVQLAAYRSMYARRASNALGVIGGPGVRALLCRARADTSLTALDTASINRAISRLGGTCP